MPLVLCVSGDRSLNSHNFGDPEDPGSRVHQEAMSDWGLVGRHYWMTTKWRGGKPDLDLAPLAENVLNKTGSAGGLEKESWSAEGS
jgi:hypothetical protein